MLLPNKGYTGGRGEGLVFKKGSGESAKPGASMERATRLRSIWFALGFLVHCSYAAQGPLTEGLSLGKYVSSE